MRAGSRRRAIASTVSAQAWEPAGSPGRQERASVEEQLAEEAVLGETLRRVADPEQALLGGEAQERSQQLGGRAHLLFQSLALGSQSLRVARRGARGRCRRRKGFLRRARPRSHGDTPGRPPPGARAEGRPAPPRRSRPGGPLAGSLCYVDGSLSHGLGASRLCHTCGPADRTRICERAKVRRAARARAERKPTGRRGSSGTGAPSRPTRLRPCPNPVQWEEPRSGRPADELVELGEPLGSICSPLAPVMRSIDAASPTPSHISTKPVTRLQSPSTPDKPVSMGLAKAGVARSRARAATRAAPRRGNPLDCMRDSPSGREVTRTGCMPAGASS